MSLSLLPLFWFASLSLFCHVTNDLHLTIFEAWACFEESLLVRIRNLGANVHFFRDLNEGFLRAFYIGFWSMMLRYRVSSYGFWKTKKIESNVNWTVLWTLSFTLLAMTVVQEIGSTIRPPKYFHKAVRHNTDPVLRGHHYWACLRSWRFLGVFCLLWLKKLELQPHESWTVVEQGSIELFLKATSEMPRASVSRRG